MTDSVIVRLEKAAIVGVIHREPAFSGMFIAHLLARAICVEADQLFNSSEKRLARMLLLLANFGKDEKPEPMIAKISQETLADMIGTTRSRVSFFMNKFRKLGLIDYNETQPCIVDQQIDLQIRALELRHDPLYGVGRGEIGLQGDASHAILSAEGVGEVLQRIDRAGDTCAYVLPL
jgi:hypothetical protein